MTNKTYYGFRYFSGKNCTWANTGLIAGELVAFSTLDKLREWIFKENLYSPSGLDGGERERVSRKQAITLVGLEDFIEAKDFWLDKHDYKNNQELELYYG